MLAECNFIHDTHTHTYKHTHTHTLKSMQEFTPNLRVPDLRCIRYIILGSMTAEMSLCVMFCASCNASGTVILAAHFRKKNYICKTLGNPRLGNPKKRVNPKPRNPKP